MRGEMRSPASATILNVSMHLFRIESSLEQLARECDRDHTDTLEKIGREMKAVTDALRPIT